MTRARHIHLTDKESNTRESLANVSTIQATVGRPGDNVLGPAISQIPALSEVKA